MNEEKVSSDKVPEKFAEWLLSMGCPPETVPSIDKIAEMCRGQYYMVWRSLMEHVKPKDIVLEKRLQVFCDDVRRCQKQNAFQKHDTNAVVPKQLSLWKQQTDLKEKLAEAEDRVMKSRHKLNQLMDKVSSKLAHRNVSRRRLQDAQRRVWLLQQVAEELRTKKANLLETKAIADSLCSMEDCGDVENKLDKCISLSRRQATRPPPSSMSMLSAANPVACSSIASTNSEHNDSEDHIISLVKCSGYSLWQQLCERRAGLTGKLTVHHTPRNSNNSVSPQSVLSHTAALHCSLALDALKNRAHIKQTQRRLTAAVTDLNNYLTGEECELLVLRCERVRTEARVNTFRELLHEMTSRGGVFAAAGDSAPDRNATVKQIAIVDKAIESKRDELKRLLTSLAITEKKTQNVRDCLITLFNSFYNGAGYHDYDRFGGQLSLPQDSIAVLRQYYEEKRERQRNKTELSLNLDVSDNYSFTEPCAGEIPTFVDELKVYLKKFNLEKNRQLVLESGDKIWVYQTVEASVHRMHTQWQNDDVTCALICPSVSLSHNLRCLLLDVQTKEELEAMVREIDNQRKVVEIDITATKEQEQNTTDKIKKHLNENILSLQKTSKTLELGCENLRLWSENQMRKYISPKRTIDGKTYKDYESYYVEQLSLNI